MIDYDVRNLNVMDGEETRLFETEESIKGRLEDYEVEGIPLDILDAIDIALHKLKKFMDKGQPDLWSDNALCDAVLAILEYYMSHHRLYEEDYDKWERQFWRHTLR